MSRRALLVLLTCSITGNVLASSSPKSPIERKTVSQKHWRCTTANDTQLRQQQVERSMLPRVVFEGESLPGTIESRMAKYKTPALSVAVIKGGKLDWSAAWGKLQVDGTPAGCDSLFQAGSLAKPVTVLAALRMQHKGLIDFDKNIDTYLSSYHLPAGLQSDANPVTLRNLFAHTSGITPGGYDGYIQGQLMPTDRQTVLAEAPGNARKAEVLEAPNKTLAYSGGGYTIAEIALQDRLGKPFEQIMREWLIAPLGMKQADFTQPLPAALHGHTARGHQADGSVISGGWNNHPEQAAAGLWATASDMAVFLIEIRKGHLGTSKVFSQSSIRELLAKPFDGHVYGFRLIGEGDQIFITHYGGTAGYRAGMTMNLNSGDGAVYLSNSDKGSELGLEFFRAVSRIYNWPTFREVQVKRVPQTVEVLQSLTGRYGFEGGLTVSVVFENEALTLVFPNRDRYAMVAIQGAPREFIHPDTAVRASFEGEGKDMRIQLYGQTGRRQASAE
jgi:CubicO group peptidase (beta-lactamase class C family)